MGNPQYTVEYTVQYIVHKNDNYYVLKMKDIQTDYSEKLKTGAGVFLEEVREGDHFKSSATVVETKYGKQFRLESSIVTLPSNVKGIKEFMVKRLPHIGEKMAELIFDKYGVNSLSVIRKDPNALKGFKGISDKRAEQIFTTIQKFAAMEALADFLFAHGVVNFQYVVAIYDKLKDTAIDQLTANPYLLCEEIGASMLPIADQLAYSVGKPAHSEQRYQSLIMLCLDALCLSGGHTCITYSELAHKMSQVLNNSPVYQKNEDRILCYSLFNDSLVTLNTLKQIDMVKSKVYGNTIIPHRFYIAEKSAAKDLNYLRYRWDQVYAKAKPEQIDGVISSFEEEYKISLDPLQKQAVHYALSNRVSIITGGPGTGKTTTINTIIYGFEQINSGANVVLAAPTGRASKRMTELCGKESYTLHRLLGLNKKESVPVDETEIMVEDIDVLIVDEFSMVDTMLFARLMSGAVKKDLWLVIVGDAEQLPSVREGLVLRDLIRSRYIPVTFLETLFRQAEQSLIHLNADKIRKGIGCGNAGVEFSNQGDCSLLPCHSENEFISIASDLVGHYLKNGVNADDMTVLCPMRKGTSGSDALNIVLRDIFNPKTNSVDELSFGSVHFRVGDRVMQTVNNYDLGTAGVFNGEIGKIVCVDNVDKTVTVQYPDLEGQTVDILYEKDFLSDLSLAYAMTVHKSQGSEMNLVIMPAIYYYNYDRNLLYTGLTRAKKQTIFIGNEASLNKVIRKQTSFNRMTGLPEMLDRVFGLAA